MGVKINEEEKHFLAILENGLFLPRFSPCVNVNISGKQSLRDENRKKQNKTKYQYCYKTRLPGLFKALCHFGA